MRGLPLGVDDPRPGQLMAALEQQIRDRTALRGRARLSVEAPDLSFSRPQRMAVERPGRLRVEVLGLFDQVAALLVTRDEIYQFYDARSGRFEQGRADPGILWRVARIDLSPEEAVGLLLGAPVIEPGLFLADAHGYKDGGVAVSRRDRRGVARERYGFDGMGRLLEMQRLGAGNRIVFTVQYSDYRSLPGPGGGAESFPFDLKMEFPRVEAKARLVFKQVDLPGLLPDSLFELEKPGSPSLESSRPSSFSSGFRP